MIDKLKRILPYLGFLGIALAIMWPLYQPGFVFLLDMVWGPWIDLGEILSPPLHSGLPLHLLAAALGLLLPMYVVQKIILTAVFWCAGASMFALMRSRVSLSWAFLAGVFYMTNPFVFERFVAGHWLVLLGFAVMPYVIHRFMRFIAERSWSNFASFTLLYAVFPILSLHFWYIGTFVLGAIALVHVAKRGEHVRNFSKQFIARSAIFGLTFIVVNSYWLASFFTPSSTFVGITLDDFRAFQTAPDEVVGVFGNVLGMYGFWQSSFILPKDVIGYSWLIALVLIFIALVGFISTSRKRDTLGIALGMLFLPALLVAVGYGSELTKPLIDFLYAHVPGFSGLRETAKVTGVLVLAYAYFIPLGGMALQKYGRHASDFFAKLIPPPSLRELVLQYIPFLAVLLLVVTYTYPLYFGASGQLVSRDYPESWYAVNAELVVERKLNPTRPPRVLFYPWHGYPRVEFASTKRIANPASKFFQVDTVVGKTLDSVYLYETDQGEWDDMANALVHGMASFDDYADFLAAEGVTHVALPHFADWERYDFLDEATILQTVYEAPDFTLYKID